MKITKDKLKQIVREELATLNEDQYGDVSFSRRKLKLAHEDAECVLQCLADKAEDEELPNWWIDKVSKAADYLNVCRDYIKTNDMNGIHEDTEKEYPIWGIPPGKTSEELLYTKATSKRQASKIAKILTFNFTAHDGTVSNYNDQIKVIKKHL